eukprot:CAMPEP_0204520410 /NCGR_PEP_ID=MMETSP0661-20131031/5248_1 /ASSEMBLY_ACC=CAM_ASM_000606 /TAXON_ID=109239 /ORGANISM="Alexandrium margalefi, Strain AMGDE01CS-322" /LENGTH=307 /DNA_ID=CAMNT_0051525965 /DNA_START=23 /DNA_END=943 /DNA_ORIENTATION=-
MVVPERLPEAVVDSGATPSTPTRTERHRRRSAADGQGPHVLFADWQHQQHTPATGSRTVAGSPGKALERNFGLAGSARSKSDGRSKSEVPLSSRRSSQFFEIHDGESSDDEVHTPSRVAWDVEKLFEFNVDELVLLARNAAWGLPLRSSRDSSAPTCAAEAGRSDPYQAGTWNEDPKTDSLPVGGQADGAEAAELQSLQVQCAFKDKQIERLRRVVCELLCWGATHWPQGQNFQGHIGDQSHNPDTQELRAGAPEFVPLGIPPLPASPAEPAPHRGPAPAPGIWTTARGAVAGGAAGLTPASTTSSR